MIRTPVNSTSIKAIGYEGGRLEVEFASGQVYRYSDVPSDVHASLISGESIGKSFRSLVLGGGFGFEKVPPPEPGAGDAPTGD